MDELEKSALKRRNLLRHNPCLKSDLMEAEIAVDIVGNMIDHISEHTNKDLYLELCYAIRCVERVVTRLKAQNARSGGDVLEDDIDYWDRWKERLWVHRNCTYY